jgi:hypothetical protein
VSDLILLPDAEKFFSEISKLTGNKSKVLHYPTVASISAAAKAGEVDFFIANGPWAEQQLGSKCFWVTGDKPIEGYKMGKDIFPTVDQMRITYGYWFIAKGFKPEELAKLRTDAKDVWTNKKEWVDYRKKRGWDDRTVDMSLDQAATALNLEMKIWNASLGK